MNNPLKLFATAPKGLEPLLADELRAFGAQEVAETRAGVRFAGELSVAYRACLWSRLANRVLMPLAIFPATTADEVYAGVQTIRWLEHLAPEGTLAVDANVTGGAAISHSQFAALKVKDAIVDQFRAASGVRPSIDTAMPDVRVNVYMARGEVQVGIDLSGDSLHQRGYRTEAGEAPLKENLAAAILLRAGWPAIAESGGALVDPMCGSGTFLVEGAQMAADIAPGLQRAGFGFQRWRQHDARTWDALLEEARARRESGLKKLRELVIRGYDADPRMIRIARSNVTRAGLGNFIQHVERAIGACEPEATAKGLVVLNPPYGERLGETATLPALYSQIGAALRQCYPGWRAAVLTAVGEVSPRQRFRGGNSAREPGRLLNLRAHKVHTLYNGAIECKLLHIDIPAKSEPMAPIAAATSAPDAGEAADFANRLRKNYRHLGRWARREDIRAWRVYDADLHDYNFAIDIYECERRFVHVQEYQAPSSVDPRRAQARLARALAAIPAVLEVEPGQLFYKQRRRQTGGSQYEKMGEGGEFHEVREGPCRLLVNFTDYLDTGLFIDHRVTRAMVRELANGRRFLNLFAYTGTATVHAALGGALTTTTVDMSRTYLEWARRNLELNGIRGSAHTLVHADVLQWLSQPVQERYGLIFLDPPTFSRSKRMDDTLDIQRDHVSLIQSAVRRLEPDGELLFSTNLRRFRLDNESLGGIEARDISRSTLPKDFERNPKIHQCFRIRRRA